MKNALFTLLAVGLLVAVCGCRGNRVGRFPGGLFGGCNDCPNACRSVDPCRNGPGDGCRSGLGGCDHCGFQQPPPTGVVTYPYYTNRGPRDFLARNPRPIGP